MSKVGSWSTTAGNNNATPPDGWPEGQAPSTVNDCAREMMAAIRTLAADAQYIDLNNTPSYKSATQFSLATADATNFEVGRRLKLFDTTTLYGTIISISATQVQVRLDGTGSFLSTSLSSVAVSTQTNSNPSAPMSVVRNKNMVINGQMNVWQRGGTFASVINNQYTADRFKLEQVSSAVMNASRSERSANASNVPTLAQAGYFLNNALQFSVSTTDVAIAAADVAFISYNMEGYDWGQIAHKPLGLSFWVKSNCTGVYCVSLRSTAPSASYVQNFTLSAANTWARFFVPFPEAPTTPYTWDYSQGIGLRIGWTLACGSLYQATAGAWTAMNAVATSSQVNFLATAGNHFAITGVQLTEGGADNMVEVRPGTEEFTKCQRYYESDFATTNFTAAGAAEEMRYSFPFSVQKRAAPTMTIASGILVNTTLATAINTTTAKFDFRVVGTGAGIVSADNVIFTADSEL